MRWRLANERGRNGTPPGDRRPRSIPGEHRDAGPAAGNHSRLARGAPEGSRDARPLSGGGQSGRDPGANRGEFLPRRAVAGGGQGVRLDRVRPPRVRRHGQAARAAGCADQVDHGRGERDRPTARTAATARGSPRRGRARPVRPPSRTLRGGRAGLDVQVAPGTAPGGGGGKAGGGGGPRGWGEGAGEQRRDTRATTISNRTAT